MPWRGPQEPGEYPTLGFLAMEWIEDHLLITDGPKMGQPFRFYDEQAQHLLKRYRLDPQAVEDDGNDAYRYGGSMWVRGQKWGKDPALAALDVFHAFGPCDFAGWDANGEPVGRPHPSPWIFVAALNDDQANNTWLPIKAMVESSALADLPGVDVTLDQIRLPCGNPMEKLTTTAFGRLGGRFTSGSITENGLMTATGEGGNTGKRSPLSFANTLIRSVDGLSGMWQAATNTWDPTEFSHAQRVYEAKDPHIYVDAKISRKKVDLARTDAGTADLERELIWLYGDSVRENGGHVSVQRLIRSCQDTSKPESERRRFFLSEILAGEEELCTRERWAALDRGPLLGEAYAPLLPGQAITTGFDGSRARDRTSLIAVRISDCQVFRLRTWVPRCMCIDPDHRAEACRERKVPALEVEQAMDDTFTGYDCWYLYGDPYKWQGSLERVAAKHPGKVLEVPTNVESRMDRMVERFQAVRDTAELGHDGDDELTQHVMDTVVAKGRRKPSKPRVDAQGRIVEHYLKLAKKREDVFIDHSVAMLLALEARGQAIEDGALVDKATTVAASPELLDSETAATGWGVDDPAAWDLSDLPPLDDY